MSDPASNYLSEFTVLMDRVTQRLFAMQAIIDSGERPLADLVQETSIAVAQLAEAVGALGKAVGEMNHFDIDPSDDLP